MNNIQLTDIFDIRIVDSISEPLPKRFSHLSKDVSTTWCDIDGCLRVLGQVIFTIDCPLTCQLYKMNIIENSNLIEPIIEINVNSTLNINYIIELDAFTVGKDDLKIFRKCLFSLL